MKLFKINYTWMGLNFGSFYFLSGDCNFEQNFCTWINMAGDQFDWIRGSGSTTSGFTGPSRDRLGSLSGIELPVTWISSISVRKCFTSFTLLYIIIVIARNFFPTALLQGHMASNKETVSCQTSKWATLTSEGNSQGCH